MRNEPQLITYVDRLAGDLSGLRQVLGRATGPERSAGSTCSRFSIRSMVPTPVSIRSTTP